MKPSIAFLPLTRILLNSKRWINILRCYATSRLLSRKKRTSALSVTTASALTRVARMVSSASPVRFPLLGSLLPPIALATREANWRNSTSGLLVATTTATPSLRPRAPPRTLGRETSTKTPGGSTRSCSQGGDIYIFIPGQRLGIFK